jgi:hypothetical protein
MDQAMTSTRRDTLWIAVLMTAAILGSLALACATPFAAFAAMVALTLPLRRGLTLIAAAWAINQMIGYGALGYPWTADSLGWGLAIGAAAVLATAAAYALAPRLAAAPLASRAGLGFIAAFAVFELALFAVALAVGDTRNFGAAIVTELAVANAAWLAALLAAVWGLGGTRRNAVAAG